MNNKPRLSLETLWTAERDRDDWKRQAKSLHGRKEYWKRWSLAGGIGSAVMLVLCLSLLIFRPHVGVDVKPLEVTVKQPAMPAPPKAVGEFTGTPQHVLASVKMRNGGSTCSGTVIGHCDESSLIISCAHCVAGNVGNSCEWINSDGSKFEAKLIAYDRNLDLSLFLGPSKGPIGVSFIPTILPTSAKWSAAGYTGGGSLAVKSVQPNGRTYYVHNGTFGGGDSGGGVFADGGLVGVISTCPGGNPARSRNRHIGVSCSHSKLVAWVRKHSPG